LQLFELVSGQTSGHFSFPNSILAHPAYRATLLYLLLLFEKSSKVLSLKLLESR